MSFFSNPFGPDESEEDVKLEDDEPLVEDDVGELTIEIDDTETDSSPKFEFTDQDLYEVAELVDDESLEEAGISRDDFNQAVFEFGQGNENAFQELEFDEDWATENVVQDVEVIQETVIINEQVEEYEEIDWTDLMGPGAPGSDYGESEATPI